MPLPKPWSLFCALALCRFATAAAPTLPAQAPPVPAPPLPTNPAAQALVDSLVALLPEKPDADPSLIQFRITLTSKIANQGNAAITPLVQALNTPGGDDPRRELLMGVLGMISTRESTNALRPFLTDKIDAVRTRALSAFGTRAYRSDAEGGSDETLPILVKLLPNEPVELNRTIICAAMRSALEPRRGQKEVKAGLRDLAHKTLTDLLKNDKSPNIRLEAACYLTQFGDNSGAEVLKAGAIELAAIENPDDLTDVMFLLERLAPAIEKISGQKFGPVPMNPNFSSDSRAMPGLRAQRAALAKSLAAWAKENPSKPEK